MEMLVFQNRLSHSKVTVTVTKVKVSNFRAKQTAHWSSHGLAVAEACLHTVKKVSNPCSIRLQKLSTAYFFKIKTNVLFNQKSLKISKRYIIFRFTLIITLSMSSWM